MDVLKQLESFIICYLWPKTKHWKIFLAEFWEFHVCRPGIFQFYPQKHLGHQFKGWKIGEPTDRIVSSRCEALNSFSRRGIYGPLKMGKSAKSYNKSGVEASENSCKSINKSIYGCIHISTKKSIFGLHFFVLLACWSTIMISFGPFLSHSEVFLIFFFDQTSGYIGLFLSFCQILDKFTLFWDHFDYFGIPIWFRFGQIYF